MNPNMKDQTQPQLRFFCEEDPYWGSSSTLEHITDDGKTALCGSKDKGKPYDTADWDALHSPRFHRKCPKCRAAAVLILRPRATYWYLDPFYGNVKEFKSLRSARASALKEHGTSYITQVGPGEINKTVDIVTGLDPLP